MQPRDVDPARVPDEPRTLTARETKIQDRWLTAVKAYRDDSRPTVLGVVFAVQIRNGAYADECRSAHAALPKLAEPFLNAPPPELSQASSRVHRHVRAQLLACVDRQPVKFEQSQAGVAQATAELNTTYREWLGVDPKIYSNPRAW